MLSAPIRYLAVEPARLAATHEDSLVRIGFAPSNSYASRSQVTSSSPPSPGVAGGRKPYSYICESDALSVVGNVIPPKKWGICKNGFGSTILLVAV